MPWRHHHGRSFSSPWWRHQMETFSALLAICAGNSPVPGEFPTQRPVTRSFDVFFDVRPNKQLSKQSRGWWFETLSPSLWRHRNALLGIGYWLRFICQSILPAGSVHFMLFGLIIAETFGEMHMSLIGPKVSWSCYPFQYQTPPFTACCNFLRV